MGAMAELVIGFARKRLYMKLLKQALGSTTRLASFVIFIMVGATTFSMIFQAADGPKWVEHLLTGLPGGQIGFLIVVNVLVFFLAFFLDFFELAFIVVPLIGPVAEKLGIDLVWFGVVLAVNMQTSFMHPPFGFALFYLRSVAPHEEYLDRVTKKMTAPITTMQIYWGAVPFVIIQVIMIGLVIAFPQMVTGSKAAADASAAPSVQLEAPPAREVQAPAADKSAAEAGRAEEAAAKRQKEGADDPMKALMDSINKDKGK